MMSQTSNFVVLQDCLEDAAFALQTGQPDQAVAHLYTARGCLEELVSALVMINRQVTGFEEHLRGKDARCKAAQLSEVA